MRTTATHTHKQFAAEQALPFILWVEFVVFIQKKGPLVASDHQLSATQTFLDTTSSVSTNKLEERSGQSESHLGSDQSNPTGHRSSPVRS